MPLPLQLIPLATDPSSSTTTCSYDADGTVLGTRKAGNSGLYTHNAAGQVTQITYPGGTTNVTDPTLPPCLACVRGGPVSGPQCRAACVAPVYFRLVPRSPLSPRDVVRSSQLALSWRDGP